MNSKSGYAKILPRKKGGMPPMMTGSGSCDMWAIKPEDSLVSPKFLFQHPSYTSQSQIFNPRPVNAAHSVGNAKKRNKYHKIGPRTLNPKLMSPYAKVPIKIHTGLENLPSSESCVNFSNHLDIYQSSGDRNPSGKCNLPSRVFNYKDTEGIKSNPRICDEFPLYTCSENAGKSGFNDHELDSDVLEDDMFSKDDYVDVTSDAAEDEESVDENYKAITDHALGLASSVH